MKTGKSLQKLRGFMICLLTLSLFSGGFYLLSYFSFRTKDSYLTVLNKGLFKSELPSGNETPFTVSKIIEFKAPFPIEESDLLNLDTLAYTSSNSRGQNSVQTGIYDLSQNVLTAEFDRQKQVLASQIRVSNDGKMILASYEVDEDESSKTIVYDAATNQKLGSYHGAYLAEWLPDNVRFLGVDDYLYRQDVRTGTRENVLKISDAAGTTPPFFLELKVMKDGRTAVLLYNTLGVINLLKVDLTTGDCVKQTLKGQFYYADPIDNKALAFVARVNESTGIYLYDITNNSTQLLTDLMNQKLFHISVSEDGKHIAYSMLNATTGFYGTEVHAAYLENNQFKSNEVVYRDLNHFTDKLIWTNDSQMLYCIQRDTEDTSIFRIVFKDS